ncbi:MAG TPA: helix-turn-helix transcriptional regulator [Longimicrobium sp.]|nr:helix-turn-helix transcriptional regulator [Longimicrobium sp.]
MKITKFDVRAARERLELSPEALANELGVKPRKVRAWESGAAPVPERARKFVEWRLALAEWSAGLEACGLPACEWLEAQRQAFGNNPGDARRMQLAHMVKAHMESCDVCAARDRWASENLPPLPAPPPNHALRALLAASGAIDHLPPWARPAAWSALVTGAYTALQVLFMLPTIIREPARLLESAGVVVLAALAGVAGGLAFSITRPVTRPLGTPGNYLGGILSMAAYVGAAIFMFPLAGGGPRIGGAADTVIFAFVSILFGTIVGKIIDENERITQVA